MAGIEEVLERLVTDPDFRARLATDPAAALAGYMLYDEDLEVLAATLSADQGSSGAVEQRTSKTTLAGLLAAFEGAEPAAGTAGGAHVAISLGDGRTIEAPEVGDEVIVAFEHSDPASGSVPMTGIALAESGGDSDSASYFDGQLLAARDLTEESAQGADEMVIGDQPGSRSLADPAGQPDSRFEIQVATSDLQNAESLPSQATAPGGEPVGDLAVEDRSPTDESGA